MVARLVLLAAVAVAACDGGDPGASTVVRRADDLYGERLIPRFELELNDAARTSLAADPKAWVSARFRYAGVTYEEVGVRWKGNRSRQGLRGKPAWKIKFDKFKKGQRFVGVKELVLNNLVEDPTAVREALGYRLHRELGVVAPRTGWAQLVVDGELFGLYLDVEPIAKPMLKRGFGGDDGTVYEGEFGCDLFASDAPRFEQDVGPDLAHADLIALAELAERDPARLVAADGPLDRERVAAFLAVSMLIGDFDGYRHAHNYRLHRAAATDRWSLMPWGLDRTFTKRLGLLDAGGVIAQRCFADVGCRGAYAQALVRAADRLDALVAEGVLDRWFVLVAAAGRRDPRRPADGDDVKAARAALRRFVAERTAQVRAEVPCLGPNPPASCAPDPPPIACEPVTVGATSFELCTSPRAWPDAVAACAARGKSLARVDDLAQAEALAAIAKPSASRWWIGLADRAVEGTWAWSDGAAVGFTRWSKRQPDDFACGEDCATFRAKDGGTWSDTHCAQRQPFICR